MVGKSRPKERGDRPFRRTVACAGLALGILSGLPLAAPALAADPSAVVIMYHRFGDARYPSTNVRIEQFEAHLAEIRDGGYTVRPLAEIVAALRAGRELPPKTIALTIDDAFLSVYEQAWPRLRQARLPFTLFVATRPIDEKKPDFMSWTQLRELADAGVTIGAHTATHAHMPMLSDERNREEIKESSASYEAMLGKRPRLFAYPYGEYSLAVRRIAREAGFDAAFGQHSGALYRGTDFFGLPRFAMNEHYGDVKRFRLAANTLPLPASDITPAETYLKTGANPPLFGFTVAGDIAKRLNLLACYATGQGKVRIERLGDTRIEVRMNQAFPSGRTRVNCTLPAGKGHWRWLGRQFLVPRR